MTVITREWQVRVHAGGIDLPSDDSVAFVIDHDDLINPPDGLGSQTLRLLDGRLESQPYRLHVADPNGVITAHLFAGGRLRIIGRWVEVMTRVGAGDWQRADLRRISWVTSPDPVSWEFELSSDASLLRDVLFATSSDIQLYPLGPSRSWHRHPAAGFAAPQDLGAPGIVLEVDGSYIRVRLVPVPVPAEMVGVVRDQWDGLRMQVGGEDRRVTSFGSTPTPTDVEEAVGIWLGSPPQLPESVWIEWPGHGFAPGQSVGTLRLYWPDGVPTSPVTPRLIGPAIDPLTGEVTGTGYRLDALVRDVLEGVYGGRRMAYDEASIEQLADLGDEGHWFVVDGPIARGDFLRDYVWRPYLVAPYARFDGTLKPAPVWAGDAVPTTGLYRFDERNVDGAVHFGAGGAEIANLWRLRAHHVDPRLPAAGEILPRLDLTEVTRVRSYEGDASVEEPYELELAAQVMRRTWSAAMPDLFSERVFALAGDGAVVYRLMAAVEETSPVSGDAVVIDMSSLQGPEAQSASRSGHRIAIVLDRRRAYGSDTLHYDYLLWDAGARAHSASHADSAHADTHSDSNFSGHHDAHADEHVDLHSDSIHGDQHGDAGHTDHHEDSAHSDQHGDSAAHTDVHVDDSHGDAHQDVMHSDQHADTGHADSHGDAVWREEGSHCDQFWRSGPECFHSDTHGDAEHADQHHDSAHTDVHNDQAHDDQHADINHSDFHQDGTHSDFHSDASHADGHIDSEHVDDHSDLPHTDGHLDGVHVDAHADQVHSDWHADGAHVDEHDDLGHQDAHADSDHTDAHSDTAPHSDAHDDIPHQDDHGDDSHADSHADQAGPPVHVDEHDDVMHQDLGHSDTHEDVDHVDFHDDAKHGDFHGDQNPISEHSDFIGRREDEWDSHCDIFGTVPCHEDSHYDVPVHTDEHSDTAPHADIHDDAPHTDVHEDSPHHDSHTDEHGDEPAHVDEHADGSHSDAHFDTEHVDEHADVIHHDEHADAGHSDSHADSIHTDRHTDAEHDDAHRDGIHNDVHADLVN